MKRFLPFLFAIVFLNSCIPLRIAPNIKDYKIAKGKRFKRGLPKKNVFVFEDPKEANEFYDYVNSKYRLNDYHVSIQVPFQLGEKFYYFSFYEVEIKDKAINVAPLLFDVFFNAALGNEDFETYAATEENSVARKGNYYIAVEVFSNVEEDCLSANYSNRDDVLVYLRGLKKEYLSTYNYNEVLFKN